MAEKKPVQIHPDDIHGISKSVVDAVVDHLRSIGSAEPGAGYYCTDVFNCSATYHCKAPHGCANVFSME